MYDKGCILQRCLLRNFQRTSIIPYLLDPNIIFSTQLQNFQCSVSSSVIVKTYPHKSEHMRIILHLKVPCSILCKDCAEYYV
jgi:hypothetical protein